MTKGITQVCVLTGRGMSAIGSVALCGDGAREILGSIFQTSKTKARSDSEGMRNHATDRVAAAPRFCSGDVLYGSIMDGQRIIDEVLVGCEGVDLFVIHCHGNPLLIEQVVKLCQAQGAELVDSETFSFQRFNRQTQCTLEAEVKLAAQQSATLLGVKLLNSQIDSGLAKWVDESSENIETLEMQDIQAQAKSILQNSQIAERICRGVRIVIAGPPNSGKSTLLNAFSGRQEVIVSDKAGTTRDWVSVTCKLGPIQAEFVDTAGLDEVLAGKDLVEHTAQEITKNLLDSCDMIVYVQDVTAVEPELTIKMDKPVIVVYNKSDLVQEHKNPGTQELKSKVSGLKSVHISAKDNIGIDALIEALLSGLRVKELPIGEPFVFTSRQRAIVEALTSVSDKTVVSMMIKRLKCGD